MKRTLLVAAVMAIITAACGGGKDNPTVEGSTGTTATTAARMDESTGTSRAPAAGTRTVEIKMVDIAYQPTTLSVKRGERIDFVFQNGGAIAHDAFIGDTAAQAEHEKEMRQGDQSSTTSGMSMANENGIRVEPGKTGRLSYTFDKAGTIEIACHEPGHYAAGMKVSVTVA